MIVLATVAVVCVDRSAANYGVRSLRSRADVLADDDVDGRWWVDTVLTKRRPSAAAFDRPEKKRYYYYYRQRQVTNLFVVCFP